MKTRLGTWLLVFTGVWAIALAFGTLEWEPAGRFRLQTSDPAHSIAALRKLVAAWPLTPRLAALRCVERHGLPNTAVPDRLVWRGIGPWQNIDVHRDIGPRGGFIAQTVGYEMPLGGWQDLGALNIGVFYDPARRTLTSDARSEEAGILALNVAADVVEGRRTVKEGIDFYDRALALEASGKSSPYTRELLFKPAAPQPPLPWTWRSPWY